MVPNVQYGMLVLQPAETFLMAETELKRGLTKKQGISDKLQQHLQKPADLKIETAKTNRNWKWKIPQSVFSLSFALKKEEALKWLIVSISTESQWLAAPQSPLPPPCSL